MEQFSGYDAQTITTSSSNLPKQCNCSPLTLMVLVEIRESDYQQ